MYDGELYVAGTVKSLGVDCVPGEWTEADTELIERKFRIYGLGARPRCRSSCVARSSTTTTRSSRASASSSSRRPHVRRVLHPRARAQPDLHAGGHRRHPHEVRARALPDARLLDVQEDPALGRPDVPAGHADAVRHRGLPREVRDQDGAGRALRQAADRARHPDLHHRDELRRPLHRGEDGTGQGRIDGRHRDLLGRGGNDPAGARPVDEVVLPDHPEPVRVQPAPPHARGCDRVLHRSGLQGRPRWAPHGPEGHRAGGGDALAAARDRPALTRPASRLAGPR